MATTSWRERALLSYNRAIAIVKQQASQLDQIIREERTARADPGDDRVQLFPGWAERRYRDPGGEAQTDAPFDIVVSLSGYAANFTRPEAVTRAQKVLFHVARGFAGLPPLTPEAMVATQPPLSPTIVAMLGGKPLPPRPDEITPETEATALRAMYDDPEAQASADLGAAESAAAPGPPPPPLAGDSRELHATLQSRLRAFYSRPLAARHVVITIGANQDAFIVEDATTDAQGAFAILLHIPWERMTEGHRRTNVLTARAQLVGSHGLGAEARVDVPLSHARVRLLSDIDDTVKDSQILRGSRTVFRNVFVRPLKEVVLKDMAEWYGGLYARGVRFHYVSNSPFELLPVLIEFMRVSQLPEGSLKLKFYRGRSLFDGLFEPAGIRKRAGVLEVLDAFLHAHFFLVGDSGEQDMELYASIAQERPFQILGVFVRDVTTPAIAAASTADEAHRRDQEFADRVDRARRMIPNHIAFRVFSYAHECVEAGAILSRRATM